MPRKDMHFVSFNQNYKMNKKKLKMKKNAMDEVNFEEEKKNDPKYKTELCKSFMDTNFCVYGNKCRFAHGYKELVVKKQINHYKQKTCNSFFNKGYCPYGSRCNFKHDERKLENIGVPYYFSHLISLHLPQLKTCGRLNVFADMSKMKLEEEKQKYIVRRTYEKQKRKLIIKEKINDINEEKEIQREIEKKIREDMEKEMQKEKDELSNSFSSEISSQYSSKNDSPIKENIKEQNTVKEADKESEKDTEDEEMDLEKNKDFFFNDFNFELEFLQSEN